LLAAVYPGITLQTCTATHLLNLCAPRRLGACGVRTRRGRAKLIALGFCGIGKPNRWHAGYQLAWWQVCV